MKLPFAAMTFLVLSACAHDLAGQAQRSVALRPGVSVGAGASAGLDVEMGLSRHFSVLVLARGVDSGLDCAGAGPGFIAPCTADGVSLGGGVRFYTTPAVGRLFAEGVVGTHRYRGGAWFSLLGGGVGLVRAFRPWLTVEVGYSHYRIGADQLEGLGYTRVGSASRSQGAFRFGVGVWPS